MSDGPGRAGCRRGQKGMGNDMFVKTIRKSAVKTGCQFFLLVLAAASLLVWPAAVASGVSRGLSICATVIIPSLFPFLVLAGFLVRSGISRALGRRLERPTRFLFGLPGCCAAGILVGFVGGYPAGGIAAGELVRSGQITRGEGRRMLRFCVNAGPAFIISAVGAGMLGNVKMGVALFGAHVAASLLIGIGGRLLDGPDKKEKKEAVTQAIPVPRQAAASAFVESVNAACRSLLYMCGFVVLFAALLSLCDVSGITGLIQHLLTLPFSMAGADTRAFDCLFPCMLEVSCGAVEAAHAGSLTPLLLGMALGWGGLSVHCQLAATLHEEKIMGRGFFAARAVHAALGGLLTMILFHFLPFSVETFSPSVGVVISPFSTSVVGSVALLLMCGMLLLAMAGKEGQVKISLEKRRKL